MPSLCPSASRTCSTDARSSTYQKAASSRPWHSRLARKPPNLLNRDLVEALQDAYQKGSTAAENMRSLHRLTLARAPLPTRLNIMRRLLVQDPNHPFMDTDIRTFERAWFKQALPFAQPFVKQGRVELIQEIVQDLQQGGYFETVPPSLITNLQAQIAKVQATQLPMLAEQIRQAYSERSISALTQLAERWNSLVAEAGLPDADVSFGVADALDWLHQTWDEEQRNRQRNEAHANLSRLLQSRDTKRLDLEIAYQSAKTLGAVNDALEQQFRAWLENAGRRRTTMIAGAASAAMVMIGIAALALVLATRSTEPGPSAGNLADAGSAAVETSKPSAAPAIKASQTASVSEPSSRAELASDRPVQVSKARNEDDERTPKPRLDKPIAASTEGSQKLLGAAVEWSEILRQRNSSIKESEAWKLKERLAQKDIVNLWFIRLVGGDSFFYTREEPPPGDNKLIANVLRSVDEQEKVPLLGKRRVGRAPQSIFAEHAAKLWESPQRDDWDQCLAAIYDELIDAKDMDAILKLDLLRGFLNLAVHTSPGYRDKLQDLPEFKKVAERPPSLKSDWLDPGKDLDKQREDAEALIKQAPRLRDFVVGAAEQDKQRLMALTQGSIIFGWISREGAARPA